MRLNNPTDSFLRGMAVTSGMIRGHKRDKRDEQLTGMRMAEYDRLRVKDEESEGRKTKTRKAASDLFRQQNPAEESGGQEEIPTVDIESAFDEQAQQQAMGELWPAFDKVAKGAPLTPEDKQGMQVAGGALAFTGVLSKTVPEIRKQSQSAKRLQQVIVQLGETAGAQLLGKQTKIDAKTHPELFQLFSDTFPAVGGGSKGFKDGQFVPVEFFIDGTGAKDIRDVRIIPVGEGRNPKTGETYRAPMSVKRTSDPDDQVSATPLGEIYSRAQLTESAANGFLATVLENDDAAAQKYLDHYFKMSQAVAEEKRRRTQAGELGDALSGLVGFNEKESAALAKVVVAGGDPKGTAELILKARDKSLDIEWRDNVKGKDGNPFMVAYDKKTGKEVARVPQWVKPSKGGAGSGAKGGKEGAMPKHIYAAFETPEQYDGNGFQISGKGVDRPRLNKFIGFKSKVGHDMTYEDAYTQFMNQEGQGSATEVNPVQHMEAQSAEKIMMRLEQIPDVGDRLEAVKQYLGSNAPAEVKEKVRFQFEKQLAEIGAGEKSKQRVASYQAGMAPQASLVDRLRSETQKKGLLPAAAEAVGDHFRKATEDPRFPGWM